MCMQKFFKKYLKNNINPSNEVISIFHLQFTYIQTFTPDLSNNYANNFQLDDCNKTDRCGAVRLAMDICKNKS